MIKKKISVTVYYIAGNHRLFVIPNKICEECDLTISTVKSVIKELGEENFDLKIKSWILHFWPSFIKGGWHPPVLLVNGRIFSQGTVPKRKKLIRKLKAIVV